MKLLQTILAIIIATLLVTITSVSNLHAVLHSHHQQDDKYTCHAKHFETKHHHCQLDDFALAFDAPVPFVLQVATHYFEFNYNVTYHSCVTLVIHYLFSVKAPPIS